VAKTPQAVKRTDWFSAVARRVGPRLLAILAGSMAVGFVYNRASPLGVRFNSSAAKLSRPAGGSKQPSPYSNELILLRLEVPGLDAASPNAKAGSWSPANSSSGQADRGHAVASVEWPETKALAAQGKIVLIDARTAPYYQAGHIPGAISLPGASDAAAVAAFARGYPTNQSIVVYCSGPQCPLAHMLAEKLIRQHGFSEVRVMPGGFTEYTLYETAGGRK